MSGLTSTVSTSHSALVYLLFLDQAISIFLSFKAWSVAVPFARKALPPDIPLAGSFLHLRMSAQKSPGHHLKHSTGTPHVLLLLFFASTFTISALSHILMIVCFP